MGGEGLRGGEEGFGVGVSVAVVDVVLRKWLAKLWSVLEKGIAYIDQVLEDGLEVLEFAVVEGIDADAALKRCQLGSFVFWGDRVHTGNFHFVSQSCLMPS